MFVFRDRVEIISPGKLPNALTVENVKSGISIIRNPILHSVARDILPYVGLGTGISRSYSLIYRLANRSCRKNISGLSVTMYSTTVKFGMPVLTLMRFEPAFSSPSELRKSTRSTLSFKYQSPVSAVIGEF